MRGVVGEIAVGGGKTGIDLLLPMVVPCRVALLLVPASLVHQIQHDYERWSQHFRLPNLVGHSEFRAGRPVLEVMSYSKLGHPSAATELGRIRPARSKLGVPHQVGQPKVLAPALVIVLDLVDQRRGHQEQRYPTRDDHRQEQVDARFSSADGNLADHSAHLRAP